jgi:hypothetical protein
MEKKLTFIKQDVSKNKYITREPMFFIKSLQYGSTAQPSSFTKSQNSTYILKIIHHPQQRHARTTAFKARCLHLLLSVCTYILLSDASSDQYGPCRKTGSQGYHGLTVHLHCQLFHAFHLWGEARLQPPPPTFIYFFIRDQNEAKSIWHLENMATPSVATSTFWPWA